jgi:hypothetical protein
MAILGNWPRPAPSRDIKPDYVHNHLAMYENQEDGTIWTHTGSSVYFSCGQCTLAKVYPKIAWDVNERNAGTRFIEWVVVINPNGVDELGPTITRKLPFDGLSHPSFKKLKAEAEFIVRTVTGDSPIWRKIHDERYKLQDDGAGQGSTD